MAEMQWSPQDAMKAYLQTLHMCKVNNMHAGQDGSQRLEGIIEPQVLELMSALAAGNRARVIVQISTSQQGITPLTIALAVAAKQTHGKVICILPSHDNITLGRSVEQLSFYGLDVVDRDRGNDNGVVDLRVEDPCEQIKDLRVVDFAVVDCKLDQSCLRLLCEKVHLNPKGGIIVAKNIRHREQGVAFVDQVLKGNIGMEPSVTTLPLGPAGTQVIIRIKPAMRKPQKRQHKRFLVTVDD